MLTRANINRQKVLIDLQLLIIVMLQQNTVCVEQLGREKWTTCMLGGCKKAPRLTSC